MNQRFFAAVLCGCFLLPAGPAWSAPTAEQKKELEEVTALMAKAGGLFKAKNFSDCGDVIKTAQGKMEKLASGGDLTVHNQLKPLHEKLTKAYQLLELEGIELPELKPLGDPVKLVKPEKPDPKKDMPPPAASSVSFVKHIVPLVMAKCGNCHVNQTKGGFAMPTYEALMIGNKDGKVIFPGDASGSRFIEVIESGDMPRNGKLSTQEFDLLKKWINEGAKFDGADPKTGLAKLVPAGSAPTSAAPTGPMIALDDGKGTVSFGRDIAGPLSKTCTGCHGTNNPRENFNLSTFAGLLKGGDSGSPITPGKGAESLLVMKLKGTAKGMRMPGNNLTPFNDELIAKIEKWINEGAKFDGPDGSTPLAQVSSLAKAAGSSHEELAKDRINVAEATWSESMPDVKFVRHETENLLVMGNVGENTLKDIAERAEQQIPKIAAMLGAATDKPLQKGRFTLFVVKERYDFTEVAKVLTNLKDIPPTTKGLWRYNGIDAAGVIRMPKNESEYAIEPLAAQQITSTYLASVGKNVPHWFSEGVGRAVAASIGASDSRTQEWNNRLPEVFSMLTAPDAFMGKELEPEAASIASYSFARFLMTDTRKFSRLLDDLRKGGKFDDLFNAAYGGSPNMIAPNWYKRGPGKPSKAPLKSAAK